VLEHPEPRAVTLTDKRGLRWPIPHLATRRVIRNRYPMTESTHKVRLVPVSQLVEYANNARTHSDKQIGKIAASITEFGFTNPILIDENNEIIAGHGRVRASQRLKLYKVPCIALRGLSDAQKRALRIADNKIAEGSAWDFDLLRIELTDISLELPELDMLGFSELELGSLIGELDQAGSADEEWQGMPEFVQDTTVHRQVIVSFLSKADVEAFFALVDQKHTNKTKSIWFPFLAKRDLASECYE